MVDPGWVLTAAHCTDGFDADELGVAPGALALSDLTPADRIAVDEIRVHPDYDPATNEYDAALLRLATSTDAPPMAMADSTPPGDTPVEVAGWGVLASGNGARADRLQSVFVPIVGTTACTDASGASYFADSMLSAGVAGADSCQGDSGGPLADGPSDARRLLGIVSWGAGCALPGFPGVYTDTSAVKAWALGEMTDDPPPPAPPRRPPPPRSPVRHRPHRPPHPPRGRRRSPQPTPAPPAESAGSGITGLTVAQSRTGASGRRAIRLGVRLSDPARVRAVGARQVVQTTRRRALLRRCATRAGRARQACVRRARADTVRWRGVRSVRRSTDATCRVTLSLGRLAPGRYRVVLRMIGHDGRVSRAVRDIRVRG